MLRGFSPSNRRAGVGATRDGIGNQSARSQRCKIQPRETSPASTAHIDTRAGVSRLRQAVTKGTFEAITQSTGRVKRRDLQEKAIVDWLSGKSSQRCPDLSALSWQTKPRIYGSIICFNFCFSRKVYLVTELKLETE